MLKSELSKKLSAKYNNLPEKLVAEVVNEIISLMADNLIANNRIEIRGFGSFSLHYRASRLAHNPKTGEKVATTEKHSPHFKPGKELKELVNTKL